LFENPSNRRYTVNNLVIKCWDVIILQI
jgi:hypothetical protein